ncbi:protein of unknown function [Georgfuchsia toluolica]|uniref:Uncharacterized protein n=1 Tax=Georgfuchsia toluolica TaxID=424218 RepID=A0A916J4I3_9PROT|nr:protein of unknown function [Georgfuchsia toluolica]
MMQPHLMTPLHFRVEFTRLNISMLSYYALSMAERAGFEPAVGYEPTHAFQACDLNRSSTSPVLKRREF